MAPSTQPAGRKGASKSCSSLLSLSFYLYFFRAEWTDVVTRHLGRREGYRGTLRGGSLQILKSHARQALCPLHPTPRGRGLGQTFSRLPVTPSPGTHTNKHQGLHSFLTHEIEAGVVWAMTVGRTVCLTCASVSTVTLNAILVNLTWTEKNVKLSPKTSFPSCWQWRERKECHFQDWWHLRWTMEVQPLGGFLHVPSPGTRDSGKNLLSLGCCSVLPRAMCPFLCLIFPNLETNKPGSQELGFRNNFRQEIKEIPKWPETSRAALSFVV